MTVRIWIIWDAQILLEQFNFSTIETVRIFPDNSRQYSSEPYLDGTSVDRISNYFRY